MLDYALTLTLSHRMGEGTVVGSHGLWGWLDGKSSGRFAVGGAGVQRRS
jgi:hypothetical protein